MSLSLRTLLALASASAAAPLCAQTVWYVDDDAPSGGDGLSWATALRNPGDALALAAPNDEVRVAAGSYRPDLAQGVIPGDRNATFDIAGLTLRGGYQGLVGGGSPDDNDPDVHVTVLNGDLLGDDQPGFVNYDENSLHVVTASGGGPQTRLIGCTVRHGNADGLNLIAQSGAGVLAVGSSVRIVDCRLEGNRSTSLGGAVYAIVGKPVLQGTVFVGNRCEERGGALYLLDTEPGTLVRDCWFLDNEALTEGGALVVLTGHATVALSRFENCSGRGGGAICHPSLETLVVEHSEFVGCRATAGGGAIQGGNLTLRSCRIEGCATTDGSGGGVDAVGDALLVEDCVFVDNAGPDAFGEAGGGLYAGATDAVVRRSTFLDNRATNGGGLKASSTTTAWIEDCAFRGNVAFGAGGGVSMGWGTILRCRFDRNRSSGRGGAIELPSGSAVTEIRSTTIADNESLFNAGGGVYVSTGAVLRSSILFGNRASADRAYEQQIAVAFLGQVDQDYCCIEGWEPIDGGFTMTAEDPRFWNRGGGDYHLRPGSPCIDAGDPSSPPDEDGSPADIGALPFDPSHVGWLASLDAAVSVGAGGAQALSLDAGPEHAGRIYQVLGTSTGASPGFSFAGFHVPLNVDAYFMITLNSPNHYPLSSSLAVLDADGRAFAEFGLLPGTSPSIVGLPVHHAFGALDPVGLQLALVSNALGVEIAP